MKTLITAGFAAALVIGAAPVVAQDGPIFEVYGGAGIAVLHGNEYVYDSPGSPDRLSLLYWDSTAPVLPKASP